MGIKTFFSDLESGAEKVVGFIVKQMTSAETLLGADTGNAKLNIVVTAVKSALAVLGIDVTKVETELTDVVNALVALFNKAGLFPTSTVPAPGPFVPATTTHPLPPGK